MPGVHVNLKLQRAHRSARRGLHALGRRVPDFTEARWDSDREDGRVYRERQDRAHLEALDAGRTLIAAALDLERKAELAKAAGVETLRHADPAVGWRELGELLGVTGQAAHKRYRTVEGPEAQITIDDELARGRDETHVHTPEQLQALADLEMPHAAVEIYSTATGEIPLEPHNPPAEADPPHTPPEIEKPTAPAERESRPPARRPRKSRRTEVLELITQRPGVTIPELAEAMQVKQNYLYRLCPGLLEEGFVVKAGRGWHPAPEPEPPEPAADEPVKTGANGLRIRSKEEIDEIYGSVYGSRSKTR